jgi:hypothetical protein
VHDRLYELTRKHWIKLHTKPRKHVYWKLLDRLHRAKEFQSPLEATARMYQHIKINHIETIHAFVKALWQPPPQRSTSRTKRQPKKELIE